MISEEKLKIHAFNLLPQFGPARLMRLLDYFKDFTQSFAASQSDLEKAGIESETARIFLEFKAKLDLKKEKGELEAAGIDLISFSDEEYPRLLREIPKSPVLLYVRGKKPAVDELCVAVVGSRKISTYGLTVTPDLVGPLVDVGVTIVSGMAFGVDSEAHKVAIKRNRRTIAVLAGGIDEASLYPKAHQLLAQEILETGGCLLSEYAPGTPNFKQNFVARNRIISGLSMATLVVECDVDSGSLITAQYALEQNRSLFAVPGPIYSSTSRGPNNLIKMGAKAVTDAKDILEDLNLQNLPEETSIQLAFGDSVEENRILEILNKEPKNINLIIKESGLETGSATSALTMLEIKGLVRNLGGQQYIISR